MIFARLAVRDRACQALNAYLKVHRPGKSGWWETEIFLACHARIDARMLFAGTLEAFVEAYESAKAQILAAHVSHADRKELLGLLLSSTSSPEEVLELLSACPDPRPWYGR